MKKEVEKNSADEAFSLLAQSQIDINQFKKIKQDLHDINNDIDKYIKEFIYSVNYYDEFNNKQKKFKIRRTYEEYGNDRIRIYTLDKELRRKFGRKMYDTNKDMTVYFQAFYDFVTEMNKFISNKQIEMEDEIRVKNNLLNQIKNII